MQPRGVVGQLAAAVPEERDIRQQRVGRRLAALENSREGECQLEERDAVQPAKIDRAHFAIVVELQGRGHVGRLAQRHPDGADPLADRPLAPPALPRLGHQSVEDFAPLEDLGVLTAGRHAPGAWDGQ